MSVPGSAWALALTCLVGQALQLAERGPSGADATWVFLSMALSALVVGWVSAGVLRARTGRLVLVWIVFGLELLLRLVGLADLSDGNGWALVDAATAIAQVVALGAFSATPYFRHQRTRPAEPGPDIAGLVLVAVVVGALGGLTAAPDTTDGGMTLRIGL